MGARGTAHWLPASASSVPKKALASSAVRRVHHAA
jgi:hypothetical protein